MSFVIAMPEMMETAAAGLADVGSSVSAANATAAASTTAVVAAGADEVSAAIAAVFGRHGQAYQAISAQAAAFHHQFVQSIKSGAGAYAAAESASASPLQAAQQDLLGMINAPTESLVGRPLIGNGANGQTINGVGQAGGAGGILWGSGGRGGDSTNAGAARRRPAGAPAS